jgi:very-short-patch-repair endonuclease
MDHDVTRRTLAVIAANPGAAPARLLRAEGISKRRVAALLTVGALRQLRIGWYSTASTDHRIAAAVAAGGAAACATSLAVHGVWATTQTGLHVARPIGGIGGTNTIGHRMGAIDDPTWCLEPIKRAIARVIRCAPFDEAIAAIDSALHLSGSLGWGFDRADLIDVLAAAPRRYRRMLDRVDPRAESGLESLVRVRLRSLGITATPQVSIDGVGRVDLLVGDRLVIETDGKAHHLGERFAHDRRRDAELLRRGYLVLRLTWASVLFDWPDTEALVLEVVRRGDHRATARHRPALMTVPERA